MEEKYYSPELQEFHYDFEYELFDPVLKRWCKFTFDEQDKLSFIKVNKSRVKLLDKVDIESLGWKFKEHIEETEHTCETIVYTSNKGFIKNEFFLEDTLNNGPASLSIGYIVGKGKTIIFSGYVKNKSELKKLMSQLKIKHE